MTLYPRTAAHVGLTVPDLDAAIRFYTEAFGFTLLAPPTEVAAAAEDRGVWADFPFTDVFSGFAGMRLARLITSSGFGIELFEWTLAAGEVRAGRSERDYRDVGFFHLAVLDQDIDGLVARIEQTGGRRRSAILPAAFPGEPMRFCYCEDPFGNIIEVVTHSEESTWANRR
jgi:catechol 2,3-dioxygenase-like lactoylglutathione lyase family enzyme